jgi:hypothetical protein
MHIDYSFPGSTNNRQRPAMPASEKERKMESDSIRRLKAIVEKHTVRYEAWSYEMNDGKRVMVGFDLELHGTHDHGNWGFRRSRTLNPG